MSSDLRSPRLTDTATILELTEGDPAKVFTDRAAADQLVAEFKRLGDKASFHYADDSTREWDQADEAKAAALAIFDAHPELEAQFREVGLGFLWLLGIARPRKESQP